MTNILFVFVLISVAVCSKLRKTYKDTLRISYFQRNPSMINSLPAALHHNTIYKNLFDWYEWGGNDGFLLSVLLNQLNLKPIFLQSQEADRFGRVLENGTITGTLGDLVHEKADYCPNSRFLIYYETEEIEFLPAIDSDKLCFVVGKAQQIPIWQKLINCFDTSTWTSIIILTLLSIAFWCFLNKHTAIQKASWQGSSLFLGISVKLKPQNLYQFIFIFSCLIFNILVFGILQSSFVTHFTTISFYKDIDTMEELYNSNLPIKSNSWHMIKNDKSQIMKKLHQHLAPAAEEALKEIAAERNAATLERKARVDLLASTEYVNLDGTPLLHIVQECENTFLLAHILPKGSKFLKPFKKIIRNLFEGGFIKKWYDDVLQGFVIESSYKNKSFQKFSSGTLLANQAAFRFLFIGYCCTIIVFLIEVVMWRLTNKIKY